MRIITLAVLPIPSAHAAESPLVIVSDSRRVFHNGEHNAFTDLCRFRDELHLTFRSCPDGHMVHPTASTIIMRSKDDETTWTNPVMLEGPFGHHIPALSRCLKSGRSFRITPAMRMKPERPSPRSTWPNCR